TRNLTSSMPRRTRESVGSVATMPRTQALSPSISMAMGLMTVRSSYARGKKDKRPPRSVTPSLEKARAQASPTPLSAVILVSSVGLCISFTFHESPLPRLILRGGVCDADARRGDDADVPPLVLYPQLGAVADICAVERAGDLQLLCELAGAFKAAAGADEHA